MDKTDISNNEVSSPDPVAVSAAKYALEVTDTQSEHPMRNKLVSLFLALFIIVGTFGAIIGTINSVDLKHQNGLLKDQQKCQAQLLSAITEEQDARAGIAGDDRAALSNLVQKVKDAKSQPEIEKALAEFTKQTAANDKKRSQYPVLTFSTDICNISSSKLSSSSTTPSKTVTTPSHTTTVKPTSSVSVGSTATRTSSSGGSNSGTGGNTNTAPKSNGASLSKANGAASAPRKTTVPNPSPSMTTTAQPGKPLLPIPGCTVSVNVLGVSTRVC